jgi:hypothetical protein
MICLFLFGFKSYEIFNISSFFNRYRYLNFLLLDTMQYIYVFCTGEFNLTILIIFYGVINKGSIAQW